ncbi:hypothetical protein GCM10028801_36090 [Nocardioides maradonensis]
MIAVILTPDGGVERREISADLATLQSLVGGLIEHVPVSLDAHLWCNEEGRLLRLPINKEASILAGRLIVGPAVLVGVDEDGEDTDLPAEWLR